MWSQICRCHDIVLQVLTDVIDKELDGVAKHRKEEDQPANLTRSWTGWSGIAESPDCGTTSKVGHSIPNNFNNSHLKSLKIYNNERLF